MKETKKNRKIPPDSLTSVADLGSRVTGRQGEDSGDLSNSVLNSYRTFLCKRFDFFPTTQLNLAAQLI